MVDEHQRDRSEVPQERETDAGEEIAEVGIGRHEDVVQSPRQVAEREDSEDQRQHLHSVGQLHPSLLELIECLEERYDSEDEEEAEDGEAEGVQENARLNCILAALPVACGITALFHALEDVDDEGDNCEKDGSAPNRDTQIEPEGDRVHRLYILLLDLKGQDHDRGRLEKSHDDLPVRGYDFERKRYCHRVLASLRLAS